MIIYDFCIFDWKMPFTLVGSHCEVAKRKAREPGCLSLLSLVPSIQQSSTLDSAILGLTRRISQLIPRVLMSHFESERAFHTQSQEIKQVRHSSHDQAGLSAEILCYLCLAAYHGLSFRIYQRLTAESCWVSIFSADFQQVDLHVGPTQLFLQQAQSTSVNLYSVGLRVGLIFLSSCHPLGC